MIEKTDKFADYVFYVATALSILMLFLSKKPHQSLHDATTYLLALAVGLLFIAGQTSRLYLVPRAEDMRRKDFFTSAFNVQLTTLSTSGYYNNDLSAPIKRVAAQALENSLFSKTIALIMVRRERIKLFVCASVLLLAIVLGVGDFIGIAAQVVLSEQILSKWLRLEWLRVRFERSYDTIYQLLQASPSASIFSAQALDALVMYETAKATGGVVLSSKVFEQQNAALSLQWEEVKTALKI